tara:strand:+ start:644 stop:997 length:354 start_codon:yes stop_codon:yes gene_type:complete
VRLAVGSISHRQPLIVPDGIIENANGKLVTAVPGKAVANPILHLYGQKRRVEIFDPRFEAIVIIISAGSENLAVIQDLAIEQTGNGVDCVFVDQSLVIDLGGDCESIALHGLFPSLN